MKTIYCCTAFFMIVAFLSVDAQTVDLSGSTTGIVPCTNVTYTVTGVPALGSAGAAQGSKVESIEYVWSSPVGGVYTSGAGPASPQATIRWDQSSNAFTKTTGRVTASWKEVVRASDGTAASEISRNPAAIEPKLVRVLHIGAISGITVDNSFITSALTVDCGVRDIVLSVTPPATDPASTVTYTWTLPSTWTLLAQGGTGGGQTSRVTVRTDVQFHMWRMRPWNLHA